LGGCTYLPVFGRGTPRPYRRLLLILNFEFVKFEFTDCQF